MDCPLHRCFAFLLCLPVAVAALAFAPPSLTPPVAGPYYTEGSRLIDSHGQSYLLRGTRLAPVSSSETDLTGAPGEFGPLSATTIITIRLRLNMNAVRLPVDPVLYLDHRAYRERTRTVVETANHLELLVVLEAATDSLSFWTSIATDFGRNPNVFFALPNDLPGATAQWTAGANQPIALFCREPCAGACQPRYRS